MSTITRNAFSLLTAQAAIWVSSAVTLIVLPRYFGDEEYGRYAFVVSFITMFILLGQMGSSTYLVREIARDNARIGRYVTNTVVMKIAVGFALTAVALTIGLVLGFDQELMLLLTAGCVAMIVTLVNEPMVAGLNALERMAYPAAWTVVQHYLGLAVALAVIATGGSLVVYGFAYGLVGAVPLVANSIALRSQIRGTDGFDVGLWWRIGRGGVPFLLWSVILFIYGSIDMLMLRPMAGEATVGWYALAYRWVGLPVLVASTVLIAMFPALSKHGETLSDDFFRIANNALRFVGLTAFPIAAGIALVAGDLVGLAYGSGYDQSIPLIVILALHIPIVAIDMVLGLVLTAVDKQKQWVAVGAMAAVLNPVLNLAAIPLTIRWFDNGAIGAASVTVLTEFLMLAGALYLRPRGVLDRAVAGYLSRCLAATTALVGVVMIISPLPLPLRIGVGVVVYGLASLALGTATRSELSSIVSRLRREPAPSP